MSDNAAGVSYALLACVLFAFLIFNIRSCVQTEAIQAIKAGLVEGENGRWVKPSQPIIINNGAQ
jgi:hypothetical protein